jgi:hypothetical protein
MIPDTTPPAVRVRSTRFRCAALLWAVVFVLSGLRPAYAEAECAHHLAVAGAQTAAEAHGDHVHGGDAHSVEHAGHAAHHQHGGASTERPHSGADHDVCTCIGPCHVAGAVLLPEVGWTAAAPPEVAVDRAATRSAV